MPPALAVSWAPVRWSHIGAAVASGALSIAAGNVVWSRGIKWLGPGRAASFNNLIPVLAMIISCTVLREPLSLLQLFGAAITVGGVWIVRRA